MLVRAEDDEAKIVETGTGDDKVIMLQYEKVVAVEAPFPKHFRVEAFCRLQQAIRFNMCDGNVHLVIGKVTAEDDGSDMVTERVFKLQSEEQVKAVMAERAGIAAVQMISSKKTRRRLGCGNALESEECQVGVFFFELQNHC